jgi:PAS domain-containing protein
LSGAAAAHAGAEEAGGGGGGGGGAEDGGDGEEDEDEGGEEDGPARGGKRARRGEGGGEGDRLQRSRERNRLHARQSRLRKKFFVDSLKTNVADTEDENRRMRLMLLALTGKAYEALRADEEAGIPLLALSTGVAGAGAGAGAGAQAHVQAHAQAQALALAQAQAQAQAAQSHALVLAGARGGGGGAAVPDERSALLGGPGRQPTTVISGNDYDLVRALATAHHNFVISDPQLPDNPIVFASKGFYDLTGYSPSEVLGRNCRFLQGPFSDPDAIRLIRQGVADGTDTAVCLANYKKDGTLFWNRFFVA